MNPTTKAQCSRILRHLQRGNTITPLEALRKFGCFRLGARIWDLRHKMGHDIETIPTTYKKKRFAKYKLIP